MGIQCVNPEVAYFITCEAEAGALTPFSEFVMYRHLGVADDNVKVQGKQLSFMSKFLLLVNQMSTNKLSSLWHSFISNVPPEMLTQYRSYHTTLREWAILSILQERHAAHSDSPFNLKALSKETEIAPEEVTQQLEKYRRHQLAFFEAEYATVQNQTQLQKMKEAASTWLESQPSDIKRELQLLMYKWATQRVQAPAAYVSNQAAPVLSFSKIRQKQRNVIKRATKLFEQFGFETELRQFIKGEPIYLTHENSPFSFKLQALEETGWLTTQSLFFRKQSPFHITLCTKNKEEIGSLCVYNKDSPVLDQLFSWILVVQSGEEHLYLEKANYAFFTRATQLLKEVPPSKTTTRIHHSLAQHVKQQERYSLRKSQLNIYVEEHLKTFQDILAQTLQKLPNPS